MLDGMRSDAVALALQEFLRRKNFAANDAVQIRDQAFDLGDAAFLNPIRKIVNHDTA